MMNALKIIASLLYWLAVILGGLYLLIWIFEPTSKMLTYEGTIVEIENSTLETNVVLRSMLNNCNLSVQKDKLQYNGGCSPKTQERKVDKTYAYYTVAFLDADGDVKIEKIGEENRNNWNSVGPWAALNYRNKLPFVENEKDRQFYSLNASPYVGCKVLVYELRGTILSSNTLRDFVVNASMCKKPEKAEEVQK